MSDEKNRKQNLEAWLHWKRLEIQRMPEGGLRDSEADFAETISELLSREAALREEMERVMENFYTLSLQIDEYDQFVEAVETLARDSCNDNLMGMVSTLREALGNVHQNPELLKGGLANDNA